MATKRSFAIVTTTAPDGTTTTTVLCFKHSDASCIVVDLRTAPLSNFHDAALAAATREINSVLEKVKQSKSDSSRELAFLNTGNGLLLAWVEDAVGSQDEDAKINRALGLVPVPAAVESQAGPTAKRVTVDDYIRCVTECKNLFPDGAALVECIKGCSKTSTPKLEDFRKEAI